MHQVVWEYFNGKRETGKHIHHRNGNRWDNRIENLEQVHANPHLSKHIKQRFKENPEWAKEFHAKGIQSAVKWHKSEDGIKWHKQHAARQNFGKFTYGLSKCEFCGAEYERRTKHSKFCHSNCKAKANRASRKLAGASL